VAYGLLGFALAFAALPLYVVLPNYYAREFGVPLTTLGAVLLGARLLDAFIDPALGRLTDRLFARSAGAVLAFGFGAAVLLGAGFALLFFPQVRGSDALVGWASAMLVLTYAGYSGLSVAHQAWAALLGGTESERSRIVAWREGLGLLGVVTASVLPSVAGMPATTVVFAVALALGWLGWQRAVRPALQSPASPAPAQGLPHTAPEVFSPKAGPFSGAIWAPFRAAGFKRLLTVFMLNGIASAVPATLVLFFIQDRLAAPTSMEPLFLGSYFLCAALSIPLWLALVKRLGLARSWLGSMLLAMAVFIWASQLGTGQVIAFAVICALSGVALGADLALPSALLAGVIQQRAAQGEESGAVPSAGAYFGWWSFATKLNLALAAGLALPLLGLFGYAPGARDEAALTALVIAYCVLPCVLKAGAALSLYVLLIRPGTPRAAPSLAAAPSAPGASASLNQQTTSPTRKVLP
jgi:GPH family glycoside/pentoside/hexuronide:cation symporter